MKKETRIIVLIALVFALLICGAVYIFSRSDDKAADETSNTAVSGTQSGEFEQSEASQAEQSEENSTVSEKQFYKTITVLVEIEGKETKTFTIGTDSEHLIDALNEIELVDGKDSDYGYFITMVDGISANEDKHEYWIISQDGVATPKGVSETPIKDGDTYELTLSKW